MATKKKTEEAVPDLLELEAAAAHLGIEPAALLTAWRKGMAPGKGAATIGGVLTWRREALDEYQAGQKKTAKKAPADEESDAG